MWYSSAIAWVVVHAVPMTAAVSIVGGAVLRHYLPNLLSSFAAKGEAKLDVEIAKLSPEEKKMILAADKWVENLVPGSGDQKYQAVVNLLITKVPQLSPAASILVQILTDVGMTAKQILADEQGKLQA
jgi:hypothetical protein